MSQPIRILCVFSRLDRGGAESMCMNLYRALDRTKVQFDFVKHTTDKGQFEDEIINLGGYIYEAPMYKIYNHLTYCVWWRKFFKQHPEYRIIHGHYFTIAAIYLRIAKKFERITITHAHAERGPREHIRLALRIKIAIAERDEKYSDFCFACSKNAGDWLFPHKEYKVLKNAIDSAQYTLNEGTREQIRKEFGIRDEQRIIGVIGSFSPVKNPLGILAIFNNVHKESPDSVLLWCGDGPLRSEIESKIQELSLEDSVILAGVRSDMPRMLQAIDVYIMPSLREGLPVAGIEAQAAGIPCLFSDTISRDVAITDCCEFLPLQDMELWRKSLLKAFDKEREDTRTQIISAGFDIQTTAEWLQDFYLQNC